MAASIRNSGLETISLPYPFRGVLKSGQAVIIDLTPAQVITALGGSAYQGGLDIAEANSSGPFDSFYEGDAAGDPVTGLSLLITGDGEVTGSLEVGTNLTVDGITSLQATTTTTIDATVITADSINADTGYRTAVAPFAEALAASQTDNVVAFGGVALGWVAPRAGNVTALSAQLTAALTGAGTDVVVTVAKNGTELAATPTLTFTQAGAETKASDVVAAAAGNAFVADDVITLIYTSSAITNTPTIVATLEITD